MEVFRDLCAEWNARLYFRVAYHSSGNGIIERHHCTIKAVASGSQILPQEVVFWYNMAPKTGQDDIWRVSLLAEKEEVDEVLEEPIRWSHCEQRRLAWIANYKSNH